MSRRRSVSSSGFHFSWQLAAWGLGLFLTALGQWYDLQRRVAIVQNTQELVQQALEQRIQSLESKLERRR